MSWRRRRWVEPSDGLRPNWTDRGVLGNGANLRAIMGIVGGVRDLVYLAGPAASALVECHLEGLVVSYVCPCAGTNWEGKLAIVAGVAR
jgi:hypothetical protein